MGLMKDFEDWWVENHNTIFILLGLLYILSGDMLFWAGFHNIDYSRNFLKVAMIEGLDYDSWGDESMGGAVHDFDTVYTNGLGMIIKGFYVMGIGILIFGYGLFKSK